MKTKIVFSFKHKNQTPLFMIIKEYYENGEVTFAKSIFELWGGKEMKRFGVNIFGKKKKRE